MVLWQVGTTRTASQYERQPLEAWGQVGPVPGHDAQISLCIKGMWSQEPSIKS